MIPYVNSRDYLMGTITELWCCLGCGQKHTKFVTLSELINQWDRFYLYANLFEEGKISQYQAFSYIFLRKSMALQWVVNSTELSKKCKQKKNYFHEVDFCDKGKISSSFLFNALCHATSNLSVYTLIYDISRHTMCNSKPFKWMLGKL